MYTVIDLLIIIYLRNMPIKNLQTINAIGLKSNKNGDKSEQNALNKTPNPKSNLGPIISPKIPEGI